MPDRPAAPASEHPVATAPRPSSAPVHYPRYRGAPAPRRAPRGGATSPIVFVLLITVPAVVAVVALRAR